MDKIEWRWVLDCFVYFLHGRLTGHDVVVDRAYSPVKPICRSCGK